jgi:hypothetical protein
MTGSINAASFGKKYHEYRVVLSCPRRRREHDVVGEHLANWEPRCAPWLRTPVMSVNSQSGTPTQRSVPTNRHKGGIST